METLISNHKGHKVTHGCAAGQYKNPYEIWQDDKGKFIKMNSNKGGTFFIDFDDLSKVKDSTWWINAGGYVSGRPTKKLIYLHHMILNWKPVKQGTNVLSVDHIDRNPLNNRKHNLRIATRKEQEQNSKGIMKGTKRTRKKNAQSLPEGIKQEDMPKFVYYCTERYNKGKGWREFFRIEKHPNQTKKHPNQTKKSISSSKSKKFTIQQKLEQIIKKLNDI